MELLIESGFTRITAHTEGELRIIILSSSVLHAWQMLEKEKALCRLKGAKQYHVTLVNKEIENKDANIFLLMFRRCATTQKEMLWLQAFDSKPCSYLNIPLKLTTWNNA
ncbi:MAG: hypothetical protein IT249_09895 [Chitinophagaceae bacterium]|nr:hypothetical protein [Chitinophagaceae bacterium]